MFKSRCLGYWAVFWLGLSLLIGCSSLERFDSTQPGSPGFSSPRASSPAIAPTEVSTQLTQSVALNPLAEAIEQAKTAATLTQTAQTAPEWDAAARQWTEAIALMQAIPPDNPQRMFAQRKAKEYLQNLAVVQQQTDKTSFPKTFPSFGSPLLDHQLMLYLSYLAAIGPPDVMVVGSSRALQGVDPRYLQAALAKQGYVGIKVFNFGINGATAQVVNFLLQRLLTAEQLPKIVVWADNARALNSGRSDRTYRAILDSEGYRALSTGRRPSLKPGIAKTKSTFPRPDLQHPIQATDGRVQPVSAPPPAKFEVNPALDLPLVATIDPSDLMANFMLLGANSPQNATTSALTNIDANGFLAISDQFNPAFYYQQYPRVAGRYDQDYQPFSLAGPQANAFNALVQFTQQQQIPLVFVSLPLTQTYLDRDRLRHENQLQQFMQRRADGNRFVFVNLTARSQWQDRYFADPSHLNRYGAAVVAQQIASNAQTPWARLKS